MKGAHLWKRILNEGFDGDHVFEDDSKENLLRRVITATQIVSPLTLDKLKPASDVSGIAIPFPLFWVEGPMDDVAGGRWGCLVSTEERDGQTKRLVCHNFLCADGLRPRSEGAGEVEVDGQGRWAGNGVRAHANEDRIQELGDSAFNVCGVFAGMVCTTLMLMGCKNISLSPRSNDYSAEKRAWKRFGEVESSYRYHVLVVRPPGAKSDAPSQEIGTMPRHVCRGHFSEYGPEFGKGLLFGKLAGRFYVPPHLKGDKKNGVVEKDYAIA